MPSDVFYTINACNDERHTFPSKRQKDKWKELHHKRCAICRSAVSIDIGRSEVSYNSQSSSSYMNALHQLTIQENISANVYSLHNRTS
jgi:hypothetical protein